MTNNHELFRWLRYLLVSVVVLEIILFCDTVHKRPRYENMGAVVKDSTISRINGDTINRPPPDENKISHGNLENDDSENDDSKNDESEDGELDYDDDVSESKDGSKATLRGIEPRQVYWLNEYQFDRWKSDYYSGSWFLPIQRFEPVKAGQIHILEDGSHNVFGANAKHARMPVDWLDLSVEHLSRWIRHFDMFNANHNDVACNKITGNLMKYIQDTPEKTKALMSASESGKPLLHPTIAVIAVGVVFDSHSSLSRARSQNVTAATLGATVSSMLRAGFGRVVFAVKNEDDKATVEKTFNVVSQLYADKPDWIATTQLSSVIVDEELYKTEFVDVNMPKAAIYGLQQAMRGKFNASYTLQWLGSEPRYWEYVYFSENDLILQTRLASHPAIRDALDKGRVLFPHRFEPIPHKLDLTTEDGVVYDGTQNLLPAEGEFINILDLDGDEDMCCDGGNDRPSWDNKDDPGGIECYSLWWDCGFTSGWKELEIPEAVKHRRVLKYTPFMRLKQGTDIISITGSEHERKCHPRKRKTPNDICKQPWRPGN